MVLPNRTQNDHQSKGRAKSGFLARCRKLLKRPGTLILGIAASVLTASFTTAFTDLTKPLSHYVSELSCQFRPSSLLSAFRSSSPYPSVIAARPSRSAGS